MHSECTRRADALRQKAAVERDTHTKAAMLALAEEWERLAAILAKQHPIH